MPDLQVTISATGAVELSTLFEKLEKVSAAAGKLAGSGKALEELRKIMIGVGKSSSGFQDLRSSMDRLVQEMQALPTRMIESLRGVTGKMSKTGQEAGEALGAGVAAGAKGSLAKAKSQIDAGLAEIESDVTKAHVRSSKISMAQATGPYSVLRTFQTVYPRGWKESLGMTASTESSLVTARAQVGNREAAALAQAFAQHDAARRATYAAAEAQQALTNEAHAARTIAAHMAYLGLWKAKANRMAEEKALAESSASAMTRAFAKQDASRKAAYAAAEAQQALTNEAHAVRTIAAHMAYLGLWKAKASRVAEEKDLAQKEHERTSKISMAQATGPYSRLDSFKTVYPKGWKESLGLASTSPNPTLPDLSLTKSVPGSVIESLRRFTTHAGDAHSAARGLSSGLGLLWLTWGNTAPLLAGAAVSNAVVRIVKAGADVDHTLQTIRVLSNETVADVDRMGEALLSMSQRGVFGPRAAAEALKTLSLAGLSANESMAALGPTMNLAVAGTTNLKVAADVLTSIGAAYKIPAVSYGGIADLIVQTAAVSKASVESLAEAFKRAAPAGRLYGVTLEDLAIEMALVNNIGITGTANGTAIINMYADLSGRTKHARDLMESFRVKVTDVNGAMLPLAQIAINAAKAMEKMTPTDQGKFSAAITSERGLRAWIPVIDAAREKIKLSGEESISELEHISNRVRNNAGVAILAMTELAITPKSLMEQVGNSLETSLVRTFKKVSDDVTIVSLTLREAFASQGFVDSLSSLATTLGGMAVGLITHLDTIVTIGKAYIAWKVATLALGSALGIQGAVIGATRLIVGLRDATLQAATATEVLAKAQAGGGIAAGLAGFARFIPVVGTFVSLVLGGYTAWKLYSEGTKDATKSTAEYSKITGDEYVRRLKEQAELMERQIAAKKAGVTLDEITVKLAGEKVRLDGQKAEDEAQRKLDDLTSGKTGRGPRADGAVSSYYVNDVRMAAQELAAIQVKNQQVKTDAEGYIKIVTEGALKLRADTTPKPPANSGPGVLPDEQAAADRKKLYTASLDALEARLRASEGVMKEQFTHQKALDQLMYDPSVVGATVAALASEARTRQMVTAEINAERNALAAMEGEKDAAKAKVQANSRTRWNDADDTAFGSKAAAHQEKIAQLNLKMQRDSELSKVRIAKESDERLRVIAADKLDFDSLVAKDREKLELKYNKKQTDPIKEAGLEASLSVEEHGRGAILRMEKDALETLRARDRMASRVNELEAEGRDIAAGRGDTVGRTQEMQREDLALVQRMLAEAGLELGQRESALAIFKEYVREKAKAAGIRAEGLETKDRTAEAGMERFWAEYVSSGKSAAEEVYGVMKMSTDKMSEALARFVTTGKLDFKGLVSSILAEMIKLQASKAFSSLLGTLLGSGTKSAGMDGFTFGNISPGFDWGSLGPLVGSANGNIMTSDGPLALQKFRNGGVTTSPMLSLFGEGSTPEAYVPLPDGRSIPVKVSGGGESKPPVVITYSPVINIDSRADRAQVNAMVAQSVSDGNKQLLVYMREQGIIA